MRVVVVTPPEPVVSLEDAKEHLRVDHDDDDALITGLVAAAIGHLDGPSGWLGRALGRQTMELTLDSFAGLEGSGIIRLPFPPVASVAAVKYIDRTGIEQTADPATYRLIDGALLAPVFNGRWPLTRCDYESVRVTYLAGYLELPQPIRVAILMLVAQWYAGRDSVTRDEQIPRTLPFGVEALLAPYRVWSL